MNRSSRSGPERPYPQRDRERSTAAVLTISLAACSILACGSPPRDGDASAVPADAARLDGGGATELPEGGARADGAFDGATGPSDAGPVLDGSARGDAHPRVDAGATGAACSGCVERRCPDAERACRDTACLATVACAEACGTDDACWTACFTRGTSPDVAMRAAALWGCHLGLCVLSCGTPPTGGGACVARRSACDPFVPGFDTCCEGTCSDVTGYCCAEEGAACSSAGDCCGAVDDIDCVAGACAARACYGREELCTDAHPCCDDAFECTPYDEIRQRLLRPERHGPPGRLEHLLLQRLGHLLRGRKRRLRGSRGEPREPREPLLLTRTDP